MILCLPWKEELSEFWVLRRISGNSIAVMCQPTFPMIPEAMSSIATSKLMIYISSFPSIESGKEHIESMLLGMNLEVQIITNPKLLVMT